MKLKQDYLINKSKLLASNNNATLSKRVSSIDTIQINTNHNNINQQQSIQFQSNTHHRKVNPTIIPTTINQQPSIVPIPNQ